MCGGRGMCWGEDGRAKEWKGREGAKVRGPGRMLRAFVILGGGVVVAIAVAGDELEFFGLSAVAAGGGFGPARHFGELAVGGESAILGEADGLADFGGECGGWGGGGVAGWAGGLWRLGRRLGGGRCGGWAGGGLLAGVVDGGGAQPAEEDFGGGCPGTEGVGVGACAFVLVVGDLEPDGCAGEEDDGCAGGGAVLVGFYEAVGGEGVGEAEDGAHDGGHDGAVEFYHVVADVPGADGDDGEDGDQFEGGGSVGGGGEDVGGFGGFGGGHWLGSFVCGVITICYRPGGRCVR